MRQPSSGAPQPKSGAKMIPLSLDRRRAFGAGNFVLNRAPSPLDSRRPSLPIKVGIRANRHAGIWREAE
jgi:hypothetical protein